MVAGSASANASYDCIPYFVSTIGITAADAAICLQNFPTLFAPIC